MDAFEQSDCASEELDMDTLEDDIISGCNCGASGKAHKRDCFMNPRNDHMQGKESHVTNPPRQLSGNSLPTMVVEATCCLKDERIYDLPAIKNHTISMLLSVLLSVLLLSVCAVMIKYQNGHLNCEW